jgi:hypothetical protein
MEIANKGEYDNSEFRKLIKRTKILKERISRIFPGFLKTNGFF